MKIHVSLACLKGLSSKRRQGARERLMNTRMFWELQPMIIAMQALSTNVVNASAQNALGVAILNLFHNQTNLYNAR